MFYYYLMASNLLLRLAWTYKLSPHLRRNHDTVLAFTLLEVGRCHFHAPHAHAPQAKHIESRWLQQVQSSWKEQQCVIVTSGLHSP